MLHDGVVVDNDGKKIKQFKDDDPYAHFTNFIYAVRSGKREDLHADVLEGHLSTAVCHAGNISYRLGKKASAEAARQQIGDLPLFQKMFDDYLGHLKAHEIDSGESIVGPWLTWDSEQECFKDNAEANRLVRGVFREPFVMPAIDT